jgi:hypothetical protein
VPLIVRVFEGPGSSSTADFSTSGVVLLVKKDVSVSSGMVANFFKTCFSAGRRIGLLIRGISNYVFEMLCIISPEEHIHARIVAFLNITLFGESCQSHNRRRVAHLTDKTCAL